MSRFSDFPDPTTQPLAPTGLRPQIGIRLQRIFLATCGFEVSLTRTRKTHKSTSERCPPSHQRGRLQSDHPEGPLPTAPLHARRAPRVPRSLCGHSSLPPFQVSTLRIGPLHMCDTIEIKHQEYRIIRWPPEGTGQVPLPMKYDPSRT